MALAFRTLCKNGSIVKNLTKPAKWYMEKCPKLLTSGSGFCYQNTLISRPLCETKQIYLYNPQRLCSTKSNPPVKEPLEPEEQKLSLFQRFKQMYRDYWYVLVPVHMGTCVFWYAGSYYMVRSGVDVIGILETIGISETIIEPLRDSKAGYFALALALYKLVTPLRYAVTVGITTFAIKRLVVFGWIKPVPSRERLKELYQEKKDNLQDRFNESKQHYQTQMKEKSTQVMEEMKRYKTEIRNKKAKKM